MSDQVPYNYEVFVLANEDPYFLEFKNILHVGTRVESFPLEDLETGETVEMKSLWKDGPAILEFGSFT